MADLSLNTNWTRQLQYVFTLLLANPIGIRQDIAMILIIYSYQIMHFFALKKVTFFSAKRPVTFKSPAIAFSGK